MGMIPTYLAFLDIGGGEFIVIVLVALVLYGGRLPEVARTVGRTVGHIKRQADELTRDFREEFHEASRGEPRTRRPYEPPKRVVPQRDPRALSDGELHDEPGAHHATGDGSSVEPDEEPGVDDLAGALGSAGSLNGAGTATIEEGDVFTIPLFGPLSKLIRNVLPEGNKTGYSVAREAKATFRLENGVLKTEDLEALTNAFRFTGRGRVDCADKTVAFDAAVNTRFAPTRMLLTPVSKLLEYTCEGTLTEPKWRPSLTKGLKLPGNANLGGAAPAKDD